MAGGVEVDWTWRSNARSSFVKTYAEEEAMVSHVNRAFLGALVTNEHLGFLLFFSFPFAVVVGVTDAVLVVGDCSGVVIVVVPAILVDGGGTAAVGGGVTAVLVVLVLIVVIKIGLAD